MNILGWGLFGLGSLLLFIFAFVGIDVGLSIGGVANLAGTITGSAMMISGAVFIACSKVVDALQSQPETGLQISSQEEVVDTLKGQPEKHLQIISQEKMGMTDKEKREHAEKKKKEKDDEKRSLLIVLAIIVAGFILAALAQ